MMVMTAVTSLKLSGVMCLLFQNHRQLAMSHEAAGQHSPCPTAAAPFLIFKAVLGLSHQECPNFFLGTAAFTLFRSHDLLNPR